MARSNDTESELRRLEQLEMQRLRRDQQASQGSGSDLVEATREEAEAERTGAQVIADALLAGKGLRPSATPLVIVFLIAFALGSVGIDPMFVAVGTLVMLLVVLVWMGSDELVNYANLFFILFLIFHFKVQQKLLLSQWVLTNHQYLKLLK